MRALVASMLALALGCGGDRSPRVEAPIVVLLYEVQPVAGQTAAQAQKQAVESIRQRLDPVALDQAGAWVDGETRVRVELVGKDAPIDRIRALIERRADVGIHRVVHDDPGMKAMHQAVAVHGPTGISAETEAWSGPDGVMRTDVFVSADDRARLEAWVQAEGPRLADLGPRRVVYERVGTRWRTYLVEAASVIGGADIARAEATHDAQTAQPIVQVVLTADGRIRFADATEAAIGQKLAIVLDGRVVSAPVVHERIPGGSIQISLGTGDVLELEAQARDLAIVLSAGAMPPLSLVERRDVGPAR